MEDTEKADVVIASWVRQYNGVQTTNSPRIVDAPSSEWMGITADFSWWMNIYFRSSNLIAYKERPNRLITGPSYRTEVPPSFTCAEENVMEKKL